MKLNNFFQVQAKRGTKKASISNKKQLQKEFEDVFTGIGFYDGIFSLHVKPDSKPYQAPPMYVEYALQKTFKEEMETPASGLNNTLRHR